MRPITASIRQLYCPEFCDTVFHRHPQNSSRGVYRISSSQLCRHQGLESRYGSLAVSLLRVSGGQTQVTTSRRNHAPFAILSIYSAHRASCTLLFLLRHYGLGGRFRCSRLGLSLSSRSLFFGLKVTQSTPEVFPSIHVKRQGRADPSADFRVSRSRPSAGCSRSWVLLKWCVCVCKHSWTRGALIPSLLIYGGMWLVRGLLSTPEVAGDLHMAQAR